MTALVQKKTAGSAFGADVTVVLDAAPTVGNLLVAVHFTRGTTATRPAGWAQDLLVNNATNADQFQICSRIVQAGDGTSYTFGSTPTDQNSATIMEFSPSASRQWPSAPFDVSASTGLSTASTISTGTTATRTMADSVSIAGAGIRGPITGPSVNNGFTFEGHGASTGGNQATSLTASRVESATGTSEATFSWNTATDNIAGIAVYKTEAAGVFINDVGFITGDPDSHTGEMVTGGGDLAGSSDYPLNAESGTYTITGANATFDIGINAELGAYTLTGLPITFDFALNAASAAYVITGFDAGLISDYIINAEAGVYVLTGVDVTFLNGYELNAESGSYAITGFDAALLSEYIINAELGSYTLTGRAINSDITMHAETGSYSIIGADASLIADYSINAEPGVYTYTGFSTGSDIGMNAAPTSYLITGFDMALLADYSMDAQPGSYLITGRDATLEDDADGGVAAGGDYFIYSRRRFRR